MALTLKNILPVRPASGVWLEVRSGVRVAALLAVAGLAAGCDAVTQVREIAQTVAAQREPSAFTATRALLAEENIPLPLIKVTVRQPALETAGFLRTAEMAADGTVLFTDNGGGEFYLDGGILRASTGQEPDLAGADTAPVRAALAGTGPRSYARTLRHAVPAGQIVTTALRCETAPRGSETIDILGKRFATTRFEESCTGPVGPALRQIAFTNSYWVRGSGARGEVIASEQWLNDARGTIRIELID